MKSSFRDSRRGKSLVLALALCIFAAATVCCGQQGRDAFTSPVVRPLSVLFVGNSLTYVNDLPNLTRSLAASSTVHTALTVRSVTGGGSPLSEHWKRGEVVRALRTYRPDVLVIQGQSTEPLMSPGDFGHYAQLFKEEADGVGARTVLFETWARPAGDTFYSWPGSGGSPKVMQTRLNEAYGLAGRILGIDIARVGEAFDLVQGQSPDIRLLDGTQHPTLAGSYLAAAVIYRALCHCSPVGATFTANLPQATVRSLQRAAASVP